VHAQCFDADLRQHQRAPALLRFQLLKQGSLVHDLKLLPDANFPGLEIYIIPTKARRFPEPQTTRQRHGEQGAKPMTIGQFQECGRLIDR